MWQLIPILLIGALLVLTGWLIGRPFTSGGKNVRKRLCENEWLVENIKARDGRDKATSSLSRSLENLKLRMRLGRAARGITSRSAVDLPGACQKFRIRVRPIGRWTFMDGVAGRGGERSEGRINPGLEFLNDNQLVIHPEFCEEGHGLRLRWSGRSCVVDYLTPDSYALQSIQMPDDEWHENGAAWLKAHMAAVHGMRIGAGDAALLQLIARPQSDQMSNRAQFEKLYLRAWVNMRLGWEARDADLLTRALTGTRALINGDTSLLTEVEIALIEANAARAGLCLFELSGRNPEQLLEADEYIARALSRRAALFGDTTLSGDAASAGGSLLGQFALLRAQIGRQLAAHDLSLDGLERAQGFLDQAGESLLGEVSAQNKIVFEAELALEAGRLNQARAIISGDVMHFGAAMNAFGRVQTMLGHQRGDVQSIIGVASLGLAECMIEIAREEGDAKLLLRALKITDEAIDARKVGAAIDACTGSPGLLHGLDDRLLFVKVKALGAFGVVEGDIVCLERALTLMSRLPEPVQEHDQAMRATILLDRARLANETAHYREALNAIRALRSSNIGKSVYGDGKAGDWTWRVNSGFVQALSILAERTDRNENGSIINEAEKEARRLVDFADGGADELRPALAAQLLGRVLEQKHDMMDGGNVAALRGAINAMRRALNFTPRERMPLLWGRRQSALGGLLAKYETYAGGVEGLESAVSAYLKSLELDDNLLPQVDRASTLIDLGRTLNLLANRTGDKFHSQNASGAFERAYDIGISCGLVEQARRAEAELNQFKGRSTR